MMTLATSKHGVQWFVSVNESDANTIRGLVDPGAYQPPEFVSFPDWFSSRYPGLRQHSIKYPFVLDALLSYLGWLAEVYPEHAAQFHSAYWDLVREYHIDGTWREISELDAELQDGELIFTRLGDTEGAHERNEIKIMVQKGAALCNMQ